MKAKRGFAAEVKLLKEELKSLTRLNTHYILSNSESRAEDPERVECRARMEAIHVRLGTITQ